MELFREEVGLLLWRVIKRWMYLILMLGGIFYMGRVIRREDLKVFVVWYLGFFRSGRVFKMVKFLR